MRQKVHFKIGKFITFPEFSYNPADCRALLLDIKGGKSIFRKYMNSGYSAGHSADFADFLNYI